MANYPPEFAQDAMCQEPHRFHRALQNAVCFIILTSLVPVLFTFYIQGVLKLKNNSGALPLNTAVILDCFGGKDFMAKLHKGI